MSSLESSGKQMPINPAKGDDNPFQSSFPLRFPNQTFVGKNVQIKEIVEKIQSRSFLIVGPRRIGKSSLLEHIHHHLCEAFAVEVVKFICAKFTSPGEYFSHPLVLISNSSFFPREYIFFRIACPSGQARKKPFRIYWISDSRSLFFNLMGGSTCLRLMK